MKQRRPASVWMVGAAVLAHLFLGGFRLGGFVGDLAMAGSTSVETGLADTVAVTAQAAKPPGVAATFAELAGFGTDDHVAALLAFQTSCGAILADSKAIRSARPTPAGLKRACAAAVHLGKRVKPHAARSFFEARFSPRRLEPGFLTGYYEPLVDGRLVADETFRTPLLARPADLVGAVPGKPISGLDPALSAARRLADGSLAPFPDRAAIETGALGANARPLVYLRDPIEAFFVHVQGSARVRLPDGSLRRLVYAGRNGHPYTSIGRALVEQLNIPPAAMGMAQLKAWIREAGQAPGQAGAALMQRNRSYIFFAFDDALAADAGPIGGSGVSLTALRSLAIDRAIWPYGLPFFLDAMLPWRSDTLEPFQRVMIAQDTGSAIVGSARGDIFFGSGPEAARLAGPLRHSGTFFVLWPKD